MLILYLILMPMMLLGNHLNHRLRHLGRFLFLLGYVNPLPFGMGVERTSEFGVPIQFLFYLRNRIVLLLHVFVILVRTVLAFNIFIASSRFLCCERWFWHVTTIPDGWWVMRTAESVVLTC